MEKNNITKRAQGKKKEILSPKIISLFSKPILYILLTNLATDTATTDKVTKQPDMFQEPFATITRYCIYDGAINKVQ